jgi:hypothetical protein
MASTQANIRLLDILKAGTAHKFESQVGMPSILQWLYCLADCYPCALRFDMETTFRSQIQHSWKSKDAYRKEMDLRGHIRMKRETILLSARRMKSDSSARTWIEDISNGSVSWSSIDESSCDAKSDNATENQSEDRPRSRSSLIVPYLNGIVDWPRIYNSTLLLVCRGSDS